MCRGNKGIHFYIYFLPVPLFSFLYVSVGYRVSLILHYVHITIGHFIVILKNCGEPKIHEKNEKKIRVFSFPIQYSRYNLLAVVLHPILRKNMYVSTYCMSKKSWHILYYDLLYKWVKISWTYCTCRFIY